MNASPSTAASVSSKAPPDVLFSIITPTFNCASKIDGTAASVFAQNEQLYEYLIIDGGSTDGTIEQLQSYTSHLRWLSEPDVGIYDAMNKGLRLARGRFMYFLGSGDRLHPGALQAVADAVARLPALPDRPLLLYGNVYWESRHCIYDGPFDAAKLRRRNLCHQAAFYERTIYDRHGSFDLRYAVNADYALNLRCFGDPEIRKFYLDLTVADYEGTGRSAHDHEDLFFTDWPRLTREHLGLYHGFRHWFDPKLKWHLNRMKKSWLHRKNSV